MRTRTEVREELLNRLGATWTAVKDSVVGKELLSLGVEAVMYAEEVNESIKTAFDTATANREMLIAMSHVYRLPISFIKPATVTIRVTSGGYFAPYTLCLTKGSVSYYNIDYVNANNEVTLYQGTYTEITSPTMKTIPTDTLVDRLGYIVDETIPQSVYVSSALTENVSRFNPLSYGDGTTYYTLYTLSDGKLFIEYDKSLHSIIYLQPTKGVVDLTNAVLNSNLDYTVLATSDYEADSLETARNYFNKFYYELNAISSKSQIRKYVNTFSNVLDCNPIANTSNSVTVYVKPTDQNQAIATFGEIESALDEHGIIGVQHKVQLGIPCPIQLVCSDIPLDRQSDVATLIEDSFKYELTKYDDLISTNTLTSRIREELGLSTDVRILVNNESVTNGDILKFRLIRGTLQILEELNGETVCVGFDVAGSIYILNTVSSGATFFMTDNGHYGDIICANYQSVVAANAYFNKTLNTITTFPSTRYNLGGNHVITDGDYVYELGDDNHLRIYNRIDVSYQNFLTGQVFSFTPDGYDFTGVTFKCALYHEGTLCAFIVSGTSYAFAFYDSSGANYYNRPTSISTTARYIGNVFFEESWFVFFNDGVDKCIVYKNIGTSREDVTVQYVNFNIEKLIYVGSNGGGDVVAFGVKNSGDGIRLSYSFGLAVSYNGITTSGARLQDVTSNANASSVFTDVCRCSNYVEYKIQSDLETKRIYDNTDEVFIPSGEVTTRQEASVGTVDYRTGRVLLNRSDILVTYEANGINDTEDDEYIVLDTVEPVLFD